MAIDNPDINFSSDVQCSVGKDVGQILAAHGFNEINTNPLNSKIVSHLYVNKDGLWLFTFSNTAGVECLIAKGEDWYAKSEGAKK